MNRDLMNFFGPSLCLWSGIVIFNKAKIKLDFHLIHFHQVLFSKAAEEKIRRQAEDPAVDDKKKRAAQLLQNTIDVINQVDTATDTKLQRADNNSHSQS